MIKRKTFLLIGAASAMWLLSGCVLPFAILEKFFPKEKVPARFTLPAGKKVLVFPDDILHPVSYPPVKRVLARRANELLAEHKLAAGQGWDLHLNLHRRRDATSQYYRSGNDPHSPPLAALSSERKGVSIVAQVSQSVNVSNSIASIAAASAIGL